jgi:hypothetical protein
MVTERCEVFSGDNVCENGAVIERFGHSPTVIIKAGDLEKLCFLCNFLLTPYTLLTAYLA